jgi:hypothetical protein
MDDERMDKELDTLLDEARRTYRVPPEPAVNALWQRIETDAFAMPTHAPARRGNDWRFAWRLAAASLVFGAVAGRWSAGIRPAITIQAASSDETASVLPAARPYQKTTEALLGQTAVLLAALGTDRTSASLASNVSDQATQLLGTTRLLLDSPAAADPQMRALLLDLELTLAQVARMQPARTNTELTLINEAVAERDIVPRIRSAVVDLSGSGY